MQVIGTVAVGLNAILLLPGVQFFRGGGMLMLIITLISGMARSMKHHQAGFRLATSQPDGWKAARSYVHFSLWQTLGLLALGFGLAPDLFSDAKPIIWFVVTFGAWPATVYLLINRPAVKAAYTQVGEGDRDPWQAPSANSLIPNDRGLQGASILMTTFGVLGCLFSAFLCLQVFPALRSVNLDAIIVVLLVVALSARSAVHLMAGLSGVNADHSLFVPGIRRYEMFSLLSVALLVATMFIVGGGLNLPMILQTVFLAVILLAWPMALSSIVKYLPWDQDDADAPNGPAEDDGRSALGFVLIAFGVYYLVQLTTALLLNPSMLPPSAVPVSSHLASLAAAATALWAGIELATFGERYRLAATIYGIVGIATTILSHGSEAMNLSAEVGVSNSILIIMVAAQLALPVAVLWIVNRS